jgi:hypothetical protein
MVVSAFSFVGVIYVLALRLLVGTQVMGWASLMTIVLFIGGVQLISVGLLGEYLWRILEEVRGRPLFVIRERLGPAAEPPGEPRRDRTAV